MNKVGTEIDVLRSNLLTFALRMQDNPCKLRKKNRHLLRRKLSFFSSARRSTLVLEVGSDIGQYQTPKFRKKRKPSEINNMSNEPEQPQKPPYQPHLKNHTTVSVCNPTFPPSKLDYYDVGSTCKTNSSSINNNLTNINISQNRKLNFHVGGSSCHTTFSNDMDSPINQTTALKNNFQSKKAKGDRLARSKKICVNENNKFFENVRIKSTYCATDKFGHKFPWVKSEKKWRQTIRTAEIVLEKNVISVTSDIEQFF